MWSWEGRWAWDRKSVRGCSGPLSLVQFSSPSPSPQKPLWGAFLGVENERGELVRRYEETPPFYFLRGPKWRLLPGEGKPGNLGHWDGGKESSRDSRAPSPPDTHTLAGTRRSHTHTHFWKPLGLLLLRPPPSPPPTPGRLPSPLLAPFPLPLSASQMPACDFQMRKSCAGL